MNGKCVTHSKPFQWLLLNVNQCQKCGSQLTLFLIVFESLYTGVTTNSVILLFLASIILSLPLFASKFEYILYLSSTIQYADNKRTQCKNDDVENDTRVSKCLSMVLCRHWFDVWRPVWRENNKKQRRRRKIKKACLQKKKTTQKQRRMAKVINHFYMSLSSQCWLHTLSLCPVCVIGFRHHCFFFSVGSWECTTPFRFYLNLNPLKR